MNNIEKKILKQIETGEIKMKPKWKFVMKVWELRGLWLLLILGTGLSIMGIAYFVEMYNPKELVEFESIGWQVFWEDFPYYWLLGVVVFWVMSIKLWFNLGENYRNTTKKIVLLSGGWLVVIAIVAVILFLCL
jgi:hypothetical protein